MDVVGWLDNMIEITDKGSGYDDEFKSLDENLKLLSECVTEQVWEQIKTSKVLHDKMVDQLKESERLLARCATTPKWWTQIRNMFKGSNKERLIDQSNKLKDLMIQIQFKISTCSGQDPLAQPQGKGYDDLKRSQPEFCGDGQGAKPNGLEYTRIIKKIRTNDENLNPNDRRVDVNELPTIPLDINMLPTIIHDGGEGDGTSMKLVFELVFDTEQSSNCVRNRDYVLRSILDETSIKETNPTFLKAEWVFTRKDFQDFNLQPVDLIQTLSSKHFIITAQI